MKETVCSEKAPAAIGPYSHAVSMEGMIFTSGQLGIDPDSGKLREGVEAQAEQALVNLENVLICAGASMQDVVKTTVFVTDLKNFPIVNTVYASHFGADYPARSCVQVAALPAGGEVEIEAIAFKSADETYNF